MITDAKYEEAIQDAVDHEDKIRKSHRWCANMRSSKSISTTCLGFPEHDTKNTKYFPVSVCCTSDYCFMTSEYSNFTHSCQNEDECFLLRAGKVVQAMPAASSTAEECMQAHEGDPKYFPFLPSERREEICRGM